MTDFSKILEQIVSLEQQVLSEGRPRATPPFDPTAGVENGSTEASRSSASLVIKELKNLRKSIEKYLKEVDDKLMPILETAKTNLSTIHKQFSGLMHLTDEQQQHIEAITKMANRRIDSLKETVAELTEKSAGREEKEAEVTRLNAKVAKLEADLQAKEAEMETQRVEYEEVLDYYESIMIKMKKAQMEAERNLRNMEVELGMESTAKKGKVLSESRRPSLKDYLSEKKKVKGEYDW